MIKIGIELNGVIRNVNKQILKYYQKDIDSSIDLDEIDEKDDVFKYAKFDSNKSKNEFIYIDYPYEIFGCAKTIDKDLPVEINNWMVEMTNREDEEFMIVYYSLNEEYLTIQSSYFFLSKIGTRVREVFFPRDINEIWNRCDVVITANDDVLKAKPSDKKSVKIINTVNKDSDVKGDFEYDSMSSVIKDNNFLDNIVTKHGDAN
jgi:hypothetical protein